MSRGSVGGITNLGSTAACGMGRNQRASLDRDAWEWSSQYKPRLTLDRLVSILADEIRHPLQQPRGFCVEAFCEGIGRWFALFRNFGRGVVRAGGGLQF